MITLTEKIIFSNSLPFVLISGPCVVENYETTEFTLKNIQQITSKLNIPFVFKSSYKKANRTSIESFTGLGDAKALEILAELKEKYQVPILTDIHSPDEAKLASKVCDILQIPAFLCRQTDLLIAAGETGKVVNIKKGQFLSPESLKNAAEKILSTGNNKILLTERGTTFGYNDLIVDMRSLVKMGKLGYPVVMDTTHSVQNPSSSKTTGGNPEYILPLAKAAVAVGVSAVFLEVHPNPTEALSDAASQLKLDFLEELLIIIQKIDRIVKNY